MRSDLGMSPKPRPRGAAPLILLGVALALRPQAAHAANVLPGHDLFEVRAGSYQQFGGPYAILGPKRLPDAGRSLGRGMREIKASITGQDERRDELPEDV